MSNFSHDGKYLSITFKKDLGKTQIYTVKLKQYDLELGLIKWYPPWNTYSFYPHNASIHSPDSLTEILSFLKIIQTDWLERTFY